MGRKIFVSYKHEDKDVYLLPNCYYPGTARDYVDYLMGYFKGDIYKGEGNEDLSEFKDETIKTRLKNKIHDSSITLVLISPNMKNRSKIENDQWIPWEISYSLKEITRKKKESHTNAILAVVLPDRYGSYSYYIMDQTCACGAETLNTDILFQILADNMFNYNDLESKKMNCYYGCNSYPDEASYIQSVKWKDFLEDKDYYIDQATQIRDHRKSYQITENIIE